MKWDVHAESRLPHSEQFILELNPFEGAGRIDSYTFSIKFTITTEEYTVVINVFSWEIVSGRIHHVRGVIEEVSNSEILNVPLVHDEMSLGYWVEFSDWFCRNSLTDWSIERWRKRWVYIRRAGVFLISLWIMRAADYARKVALRGNQFPTMSQFNVQSILDGFNLQLEISSEFGYYLTIIGFIHDHLQKLFKFSFQKLSNIFVTADKVTTTHWKISCTTNPMQNMIWQIWSK